MYPPTKSCASVKANLVSMKNFSSKSDKHNTEELENFGSFAMFAAIRRASSRVS